MMQALTLSKRTIIRSVLFVIVFWSLTGILMYGLYHLVNFIDVSAILHELFA